MKENAAQNAIEEDQQQQTADDDSSSVGKGISPAKVTAPQTVSSIMKYNEI